MSEYLTARDQKAVLNWLWKDRAKWRKIGIQLDFLDLDAIEGNYRNLDDCIIELIKRWLRQINPKPTWDALVDALDAPLVDCKDIARAIENKHIPTRLSSVSKEDGNVPRLDIPPNHDCQSMCSFTMKNTSCNSCVLIILAIPISVFCSIELVLRWKPNKYGQISLDEFIKSVNLNDKSNWSEMLPTCVREVHIHSSGEGSSTSLHIKCDDVISDDNMKMSYTMYCILETKLNTRSIQKGEWTNSREEYDHSHGGEAFEKQTREWTNRERHYHSHGEDTAEKHNSAVCPSLSTEHGNLTFRYPNFNEKAVMGTEVFMECDEGYGPLHGLTKLYCDQTYTWKPYTPTCDKLCPTMDLDSKLHHDPMELYPGTVVNFSCDDNYTLKGSSSMKCLEGNWTAKPPICLQKLSNTVILQNNCAGSSSQCPNGQQTTAPNSFFGCIESVAGGVLTAIISKYGILWIIFFLAVTIIVILIVNYLIKREKELDSNSSLSDCSGGSRISRRGFPKDCARKF